MILRIAGVNHFDPAGRQKLVDCLLLHAKEFGTPAFIGVEWDKDIFTQVKAQRKKFRQLISNQWPELSLETIKALTLSLGYEADSHTEIFPDVKILWLDIGRQASEEVVKNYAHDRFTMYKRWLCTKVIEKNATTILAEMGKMATDEAGDPPKVGNERDAKFADLIPRQGTKGVGGWASIIVGKFHAMKYGGSMLQLLEEKGQICRVYVL
jgi:hypothetical protein